jgi:hypothetical protein
VQEPEGLTLAHEALLTQWGRLKRWIAEAREDRLLAEAIERDAREWARAREAAFFWKKRRLVAAEDLARRGGAELSETAREFIARARASERFGRVLVTAAGIGLGIAAVLGTIAYVRDVREREAAAVAAQNEAERHMQAEADARTAAERAAKDADEERKRADEAQAAAQRSAEDFREKLDSLEARIQGASLEQLKKLKEQVEAEKAGSAPSASSSNAPTAPAPTAISVAPGSAAAQVGAPP